MTTNLLAYERVTGRQRWVPFGTYALATIVQSLLLHHTGNAGEFLIDGITFGLVGLLICGLSNKFSHSWVTNVAINIPILLIFDTLVFNLPHLLLQHYFPNLFTWDSVVGVLRAVPIYLGGVVLWFVFSSWNELRFVLENRGRTSKI